MPQTRKAWSPSATYCASILHIIASVAILEQVQIQQWSLLLASIILLLVVGIKEFWADLTWLENDTVEGSGLDFACYAWGVIVFWVSTWMLWLAVCSLALSILIAVVIDVADQNAWDGKYD